MIPFVALGGDNTPLHFLHANGYPPNCYGPLLKRFATKHQILGMLLRPLWPNSNPSEVRDWHPFSQDLLRLFDERRIDSAVGVGHSIGAIVTLRAAINQPARFRALVLLDPVLFPRSFILVWDLFRTIGRGYRFHPLIKGALRRRRDFDDLDTVFKGYRKRPIFRYISDEHLRVLIDGLTEPKTGGGFKLAYSPEWEARVYATGIWRDWDLWTAIPRLEIPTLIIRGAETDTFWKSTARLVMQKNPKIKIVTLEHSTHLLPLEKPDEVYEIIESFLGTRTIQ